MKKLSNQQETFQAFFRSDLKAFQALSEYFSGSILKGIQVVF